MVSNSYLQLIHVPRAHKDLAASVREVALQFFWAHDGHGGDAALQVTPAAVVKKGLIQQNNIYINVR
jgi:hypothetical protein